MKKILCLILAVLFVIMLSVSVFAGDEPDIADENTDDGRRMQTVLLIAASALAVAVVAFVVTRNFIKSK